MRFFRKLTKKENGYLLAILNLIAILVVTILVIGNYYYEGIVYFLVHSDLEVIQAFFESKQFWIQSLIVLVLVLIEVIIGLIPAVVMYPIIGLMIGVEMGIFLIFVGNIVGNSVNYIQGKIIANAFTSNPKNTTLLTRLTDGGAWSLFLLRLNPLTSFDSLSYLAGALGMKYYKFLVSTMLGVTPLVVVGTLAGDEFLVKYQFGLEILGLVTLGYIIYTIIKIRWRKGFFGNR